MSNNGSSSKRWRQSIQDRRILDLLDRERHTANWNRQLQLQNVALWLYTHMVMCHLKSIEVRKGYHVLELVHVVNAIELSVVRDLFRPSRP